jgi:hypothetical protein
MFCKGYQENKSNDLRNDLETDYRILTGEIIIEKLNVEDLYEIVRYGWDRRDLQKMLDEQDYAGIGMVAAWIRECGNGSGFMVDDDPYVYPLDEDGNYTREGLGRCC